MHTWVQMETQHADFGDARLDARYQLLLEQLSDKPSLSIPAACGGTAETVAAYRFFDNDKTDPPKVLSPHRLATLERVRAETVVIAAQDTTEIDLTRNEEQVGGPLNDTKHWGLYTHPLLVMTTQRVPLGVVNVQMWSRDPKEFEKTARQRREERRAKPFEDKESHRWRDGYEAACQIATEAPHTKVICVSDSEGDIYECFLAGESVGVGRAEWIVRGCQDRAVVADNRLLPLLASRASLGHLTIQVSKREATTGNGRKRTLPREAREARVVVRSTRTLLRAPSRPDNPLPAVWVNVILVREENPPRGAEPIEWLLVTSLPVETFAEACSVIEYYCCRWEIEHAFRLGKQEAGLLDYEGRDYTGLLRHLTLALLVLGFVACHTQQLRGEKSGGHSGAGVSGVEPAVRSSVPPPSPCP